MRAVIEQARARPNVRIWQNSFTIDLLTHEGRCRGALVWDRRRGPALVWARAAVLATGGAGQLYRESTNPPIATADGHALAYRAGAELRDMEFMQFHPTVLYIAGSARHLLTEALRGEGAYLRDRDGRPVHARLSPAGRARPARRRLARHRRADGQDAASLRLPRPVAPRPADRSAAGSRASTASAGASTSTSPATRSRSAPGPTT